MSDSNQVRMHDYDHDIIPKAVSIIVIFFFEFSKMTTLRCHSHSRLFSIIKTRGHPPACGSRSPSRIRPRSSSSRSTTRTTTTPQWPPGTTMPASQVFPRMPLSPAPAACFATQTSGTMENATTTTTTTAADDAGVAAPASSWVGHQGAAAFDLRSE